MFTKKRLITAAVLVVATITIVIAVAIVAVMLFRSSGNTVAMPGATAVGAPNGPATTKSIGPAGGSIASTDGRIVVEVPPNAVPGPLNFSIQPITNLAHGGVGSAYRLEPGGQKFAPPIKVSFKFDAQDLKGYSPEALAIAYQDPTGVWQTFRTVNIDQASKTLTFSTAHFTDLSVWTIRLSPEKAMLHVGETQLIALEGCIEKDGWGSKLKTLLGTQTCQFFMPQENSWSVNVGTITMVPGAALYTAPAKKPSPNVATVRLVFRIRGVLQKDVRNCEITIVDRGYRASGSDGPTSYSGTICSLDKEFTVTGHNGPLTYLFTFSPSGDGRKGTGSLVGSYSGGTWTGGGPYKIERFDSDSPRILWQVGTTISGKPGTTSGGGIATINLVPLNPDEKCKQ